MKLGPLVYLDVEPQRTATDVGGWEPEKFGLAVAVGHLGNQVRIFTEQNVEELARLLQSARWVVGYNAKDFDFRVIGGCRRRALRNVKCFDLMLELEKIVGFRISLGSLIHATFGIRKKSSGLQVVKQQKEGNLAKVIEACCNDVMAIKALHEYGVAHGEVFFSPANSHRRMQIPVPWRRL